MTYSSFQDLPKHLQAWLRRSDQPDLEKWVRQRVPALQNRSIMEMAAMENGEQILADFLGRLETFR